MNLQLLININPKSTNFSDLVSLALHQLVAVRLRSNPLLIEKAKSNLQNWLDKTSNVTAWIEWKTILETKSLEVVLEILTTETDEGQRLRSSSPFVGLVTVQERKAIIEYCEKAKPF
jgi:hypothetical protein